MSDNGMTGGGSGNAGKPLGQLPDGTPMKFYNAGMKGLKGSADEGGVRVPFFVRWDGQFEPGRDIDTIAAHIDILPTLAALAGAKLPEDQVEGRSLLPAPRRGQSRLAGPLPLHPQGPLEDRLPSPTTTSGRASPSATSASASSATASTTWSKDPGQTETDIAADHPEVVAEMREAYDAFWKEDPPAHGQRRRPHVHDPPLPRPLHQTDGGGRHPRLGTAPILVEGGFHPAPMSHSDWDAIIVGAGPAGSTCAALLAASGLRILVFEKSKFPRGKVCGDCLNPSCHPILDKLGVARDIECADHATARSVLFVSGSSKPTRIELPIPEVVIARSGLDHLLAQRALANGAEISFESPVERVEQNQSRWRVFSGGVTYSARYLIAADGRNSTVARLLGILPPGKRGRAALQSHLPLRPEFEGAIQLQILPRGYVGIAPIGPDKMNVCLVSRPEDLAEMRGWANCNLGSHEATHWGSIAPLDRAPVSPTPPKFSNLALLGDAARVVEPFTGEGIYYGLKTGELAAEAIFKDDLTHYQSAHAQLYRGRLWLNQLSRIAVTHPRVGASLFRLGSLFPSVFRSLTRKVTAPAPSLVP